ncbi:MAG: glutaredoxin [Clostridia bacterium]|nr:glutaredoxin [Clostridia bacterium]
MFIIYGSPMCPDCRECKANFDAHHIEYEYRDVCASLRDLKQFLIYRDTMPVFDRLKAIHDIGLPAIVSEDGTVFTDWEGYLASQGLPIVYKENGQACSLDHKGC